MKSIQSCSVGPVEIGSGRLVIIAGPCLAESRELCISVASELAEICRELDIGYIFKASFDKANRSSISSPRGPGMEKGLQWLADVKEQVGVPVTSDIHEPSQAAEVSKVLDCIQIPAFLSRQSDLLVAAGETQLPVNIKKGQFMSPAEMEHATKKVLSTGNDRVLLTERGTFFGYNRLVTDFRSLVEMRRFAPVIFDATHSVMEPAGAGDSSGGQRKYAPILASAAVAVGVDALFFEVHPTPEKAQSDSAVQIPIKKIKKILTQSLAIHRARCNN